MKKASSILLLILLAATLLTACSSSNNAASGGGSTTTFSAAGGEGINTGGSGYGGNGGTFNVYPLDNTAVKISRSGSVDTSVDTTFFDKVLSSASLTTGAVPLDVTTNMTISTYPSGTETGVAEGQYHLHAGDSTIYKLDTGVDVAVTGIRVHPGVTLTLGLNMNNNVICPGTRDIPGTCDTGYDTAQISVTNDIWNQGTIKTLDLVAGKDDVLGSVTNIADGTALDKGSLNIVSSNVFLNDGMITTKGTDTTLTTGGWGGYIYVRANMAFVNRGTIDTSGGNGTEGGSAGYSWTDAGYGIWSTGPVNAKGGTGMAGYGGAGNRITFQTDAWQSLLYNSGTQNSSGGDGTDGGGEGSGSTLNAGKPSSYACGAFVNSGRLIGNGGNATTSGDGGNGAAALSNISVGTSGTYGHDLGAFGCDLRNSGTIEMKGGTGTGVGGGGGELYVWTAMNYDYSSLALVAPGSIFFGGNVLADGGTGQYGGFGGDVTLFNYSYLTVLDSNGNNAFATNSGTIKVLGFSNVNLKGGKGATDGGFGGFAALYWDLSDHNNYSSNLFIVTPSSIYNDTDFDMAGGQGVAGIGGDGGIFFAEVREDYLFLNIVGKPGAKSAIATQGSIENHGAITTKGGQGATNGGSAGPGPNPSNPNTGHYSYSSPNYTSYNDYISIFMFASGNITNTGALNASGGPATNAIGGYGYPVVLDAVGNVLNSGAITVSGGNGSGLGGSAGWVKLFSYAGTDVNTAAIAATGGHANPVNGIGGSGGSIYIYTKNGPIIATSTGTLSMTGGAGATPGSTGSTDVGWAP
jgi:predicted small secreted protein